MFKNILAILMLTAPAAWGDVIIPVSNGTNTVPLGKGYNQEKDLFRGECVDGNVIYEGKQESNFGLSSTISQKSLSDELGFSAGFKVKTGVTTHKGSAKFLKSTMESGYSISSTFYSNYSFKDAYLENPTLTPMAQGLLNNPERFKTTCGDHFIQRRSRGAKLFYNIKIEFSSKKSKDVFQANYNFNGSFASAYAKLKKNKSKFSKKTSVKFSAIQIGGDISKLTGLISNGETSNEAKSTYAFVDCSFGDFSKCDEVMKAALDYATDNTSGFPSQIAVDNNDQNTGPASLTYTASDYESLGVYVELPREVTFTIKNIRRRLSSLFDELFNQATKVEHMLSSSVVRLTTNQREKFLTMKNDLDTRVELTSSAIYDCFQAPLECREIRKELLDNEDLTKLYTDKELIVKKENFAQFCDFSKSMGAKKELKDSIDAMIAKAKEINPEEFEENNSESNVDQCYAAQTVLEGETELDLSDLKITDIRALRMFYNLEKLNLSLNQIRVIDPLLQLKNLRVLNLSGNSIETIRGIGSLENLENLNLSTNDLLDVSEIEVLKHVKRLDIRNNAASLNCPLKDKTRCIKFDVRGKIQSFSVMSSELETPRLGHQSIKIGSKIITLGGFYKDEMKTKEHRGVEVYGNDDFSYLQFKSAEFGNKSFVYHKMMALEGNDFISVGGLNSNNLYHFSINKNHVEVESLHRMNNIRVDHTLVRKNDEVFIIGGFKRASHYWNPREATRSVEIYNFRTQLLRTGASLNIPRAGHTATLLDDGRILVVGGFNLNGDSINTAELYDPKLGRFVMLNSFLKDGRGYHKAIKGNDGKVYIFGGYKDATDATGKIEIFDPKENSFFESIEHLVAERGDFQAILMESGHIMIAGGAKTFNIEDKDRSCVNCTDRIEIYDPFSQSVTMLKSTLSKAKANFTLIAIDKNKMISIGGSKEDLRDEIYTIMTLIGM